MRKYWTSISLMSLLSALLGLAVKPALADRNPPEDFTDLTLQQLLNVEVVTASRLAQKSNQAPASIEVLTADDIRTFGWRTLADALSAVRGLFVSNNRNYSFLGTRGFMQNQDYNSRVLLMIDGQRMNENVYDGGYIGQEFMLDMDLIERIEYISGSGSSIYGGNAFVGMINVVTKNGKQVNGTQIANEIGTFDTFKNRLTVGKHYDNGTDVLLSASHFDSSGVEKLYVAEFDSPETNHGIAQNMDSERADRLFGKIKWGDFTVSGGYVERFRRVPTAEFNSIFNDPDLNTKDQQIFGNLRYDKQFNDNTRFMARGYYQTYTYWGRYPWMMDDGNKNISLDSAKGRWWGGEAQLTTTLFNDHRLVSGVEFQYDQSQSARYYDVNPYFSYTNVEGAGSRIELYLQDDYHFADDWILSMGLRWDRHHMLKSDQLNPRLGLIWNPLDNMSFKLLYSSSFRAPNFSEQYNWSQPIPALREERIKSYEAVMEWAPLNGLKLLGTLFYNEATQVIEDTSDIATNRGHYTTNGTELQAEWRSESGRLLKASYTYNFLSNKLGGAHWGMASPKNLFKIHYGEPLFNDFARLGIESLYVDERLTLSDSIADAYNMVNLNLSSDKIIPYSDVSFSVYNLFDSHYPIVGGETTPDIIPMNGRELRLKLTISF